MTVPISQFYPLLLVLWGIVFWCRSKVLRATLLLSLAFHSVFLVRLSDGETGNQTAERIVAFTFVQGGEETQEASPQDAVGISQGPSEAQPEARQNDSRTDSEAEPETEEAADQPREPRVEDDLPPIEDTSLVDSSAHPLAESYRRELQRLIARQQKATPELLERGFEGRVKVWFNLSRDGKLNPPVFADRKVRSSHQSVNQAAVESVIGAAGQFPPFPDGIGRADIWFHIYLDFSNVRFHGD